MLSIVGCGGRSCVRMSSYCGQYRRKCSMVSSLSGQQTHAALPTMLEFDKP